LPEKQKGSMKKQLLIGVMAAVLAFPALLPARAETADAAAQAQQSELDRVTLAEARVTALKLGLKLTAAQEKNWDSLETVLRGVIDERATRRKAFWDQLTALRDKDEVILGLQLGAKDLAARSADLQKIAVAATPLFDSLDAAQKHRFALLLRSFAGHPAQK
jgi:hypothetical protein